MSKIMMMVTLVLVNFPAFASQIGPRGRAPVAGRFPSYWNVKGLPATKIMTGGPLRPLNSVSDLTQLYHPSAIGHSLPKGKSIIGEKTFGGLRGADSGVISNILASGFDGAGLPKSGAASIGSSPSEAGIQRFSLLPAGVRSRLIAAAGVVAAGTIASPALSAGNSGQPLIPSTGVGDSGLTMRIAIVAGMGLLSVSLITASTLFGNKKFNPTNRLAARWLSAAGALVGVVLALSGVIAPKVLDANSKIAWISIFIATMMTLTLGGVSSSRGAFEK